MDRAADVLTRLSFPVSIQGAFCLLYRQWCVMDVLLTRDLSHLWRPTAVAILTWSFLETSLHVVLLLSLLLDRRWRFMMTLWLYGAHLLCLLHTAVAGVTVLRGGDDRDSVLALVMLLWLTWYNTYHYVADDQRTRDLEWAAGRGDGRPSGGSPSQRPALPDPSGFYLLVPSHSEPRLRRRPLWEKDLDSWRSMARLYATITTVLKLIGMMLFGYGPC